MLFASTVGTALAFPVIGSTLFGLFVLPLSNEFGWGRGDISVAYAIMGWLVAAGSPLLGTVLDRVGPRRVLLTSTLLFGIAICSASLLTGSLWHLYLLYVCIALAGVGVTPVSFSRAIVGWFDANRGLALGIGLCGIGVGSMLGPPFVDYLMQTRGWREAYLALGLLVLCVSLPLASLWMHDPPELAVGSGPSGNSEDANGYTFPQVIRSRAFLLILIGIVLLGLFTGATSVHLVPLLQDRGAAPTSAALAVSVLGFAAIVGRLLGGLLIDRYHPPLVVGTVLCAPALGVTLLTLEITGPAIFVVPFLVGIGFGAEMDFLGYLVSRYLGLRTYGKTYGLLYGAMIAALGIGPLLMGYAQQVTGRYDQALVALAIVTILAIVPFTLLGPQPRFAMLAGSRLAPSRTHQYSR